MNRPILLVASRHTAVAGALRQYIDLFFPNGELSHRTEQVSFSSSAELFERLDSYTPEQLRETMMLFDLGSEDGTSWEVSNMWSESGLAAQLLMSYPEVYFVFLHQGESAGSLPFKHDAIDTAVMYDHHFIMIDRLHTMVELIQHHARGFRTIFDATGLRSLIKQKLLNAVGSNASKIYEPLSSSRQKNVAAVADEESAFVYLNGYVAYQAGFSSWLLGTRAEFSRIFWRSSPQNGDNGGPRSSALKSLSRVTGPKSLNVVLSDWDLAFPDYQGGHPSNSLLMSDGLFHADESLILITSFNDQAQQKLLSQQNGFRESKPYGGIFRLITRSSLLGNPLGKTYKETWSKILKDEPSEGWLTRLAKAGREAAGKLARASGRLVDGIKTAYGSSKIWLSEKWSRLKGNPAPTTTGAPEADTNGTKGGNESSYFSQHSAPYARSVVADRLLTRARSIRAGSSPCTEDSVQMALLAGEAKEILGGMSRTTAYYAVALQNEAEVSAEVSFLGMSAKIEVTKRLDKLKQEGRVVHNTQRSSIVEGGQSESKEARRESEEAHLNFLLQAVKNLRLRFSEHEQMEAAEECLRAFAEYQYNLLRWELRPLPLLRKASELYLIKATKSGTSVLQLLLYCCGWIIIFGFIYSMLLLSHIGFMASNDNATPDSVTARSAVPGSSGATRVNAPPNEAAPTVAPFNESQQDQTFEQWLADFKRPWNCVTLGMWHSLFTFLELQPGLPDIEQLKMEQTHDRSYRSMGWMLSYRVAVLLELIVAYLHLGLLVSVLYRRITRRSP